MQKPNLTANVNQIMRDVSFVDLAIDAWNNSAVATSGLSELWIHIVGKPVVNERFPACWLIRRPLR